ncbi:MAG: hypothetical protein SCH71_13115 [Desulfobulbaceae bacterium]|nr:hypothetical protein [Desulfobulbaceae bacterium]
MSEFKQEWTVESAMEILGHPTVDSRIWAEAVEWLLLYGPPEIQEILKQASSHAIGVEFPDLKPKSFTESGDPVYSIAEVAEQLGISEEEAAEVIARKEEKHGILHRVDEQNTRKMQ